MSSLKKISDRMSSVRATRQITSSMKVVAVSRLKQKHAVFLRAVPYADELNRVIRRLVRSVRQRQQDESATRPILPPWLEGTGSDGRYVVVMITADDGLSGTASVQVMQQAVRVIDYLQAKGKNVQIFAYGTRGADLLRTRYPDKTVSVLKQKAMKDTAVYVNAERLTAYMIELFDQHRFDVCLFVYNQFKSVVSQVPVIEQVIPNRVFYKENPWDFLNKTDDADYIRRNSLGQKKIALKNSAFLSAIGGADMLPSLQGVIFKTDPDTGKRAPFLYDYEPSDTGLLHALMPQYLTAYIYRVLLEAEVSDNAARLMAMDNATRNAGDMLNDLVRHYRRVRQSRITTDITETAGHRMGKET